MSKSVWLKTGFFAFRFSQISTPFLYLFAVFWLVIPYAFWNYDEYGAYVTVLELDDPSVIQRYDFYLQVLGISSETLRSVFLDLVLPLFVIPIRWTYALGISPLYSMLISPDLNWELQRLILLAPHLVCSCIGIGILSRILRKSSVEECSLLLSVGVLSLSAPFVYWSATLTSYSYHLLCFALLVAGQSEVNAKPRLFGRHAVFMSLVCLFNYQYLPVVFLLGCLDVFRHGRKFLYEGEFKKWCGPAVIAIYSSALLLVRAGMGKHSSANFSDLSPSGIAMYSPSFSTSSWFESSDFLLNRLFDVIYYLFFEDDFTKVRAEVYSSFEIGAFVFPVILFIFVLIRVFYRAQVSQAMKVVVLVSLFVQMFLYMIGVNAITPSRHALVLLLPAIFLCVVTFVSLAFKVSSKFSIIFSSVVPFILIALGVSRYDITHSLLDDQAFIDALRPYKVDGLLLPGCAFEPIFHSEIRHKYQTIYTCGSEVFREVPDDWSLLAVYSPSPNLVVKKMASEMAAPLLGEGQWVLIGEPLTRLCRGGYGVDAVAQCSRRIFIFAKEK